MMAKVILDVAISIDGYWEDETGESLFPVDEMHSAGMIAPLVNRTGAAILSQRSFEMVENPDWYAGNYEFQVPLFVVTGSPPVKKPKENEGLRFTFVTSYEEALTSAQTAAGCQDVMVIGEPNAAGALLNAGAVDELYVRIVPKIIGAGTRAFEGSSIKPQSFKFVSSERSDTVVHLHFRRNV